MKSWWIESLNPERDREVLRAFIAQCPFKWFQEYLIADEKKWTEYLLQQLLNLPDNQLPSAIAIQNNRGIVGLLSLSNLSWERTNFGIAAVKIGHLLATGDQKRMFQVKKHLLDTVLPKCERGGIQWIVCRVMSKDITSIHALEASGFRWMDSLAIMSLAVHQWSSLKDFSACIREYQPGDATPLQTILAEQSFSLSRFHVDPHLCAYNPNQVYGEWVAKACANYEQQPAVPKSVAAWEENDAKGFKESILVATVDEKIEGFITYKIQTALSQFLGIRLGSIEMIMVSCAMRGKGLGTALIQAALDQLSTHVDMVEISTWWDNYSALRTYQKFGFRIVSSLISFHKWF